MSTAPGRMVKFRRTSLHGCQLRGPRRYGCLAAARLL